MSGWLGGGAGQRTGHNAGAVYTLHTMSCCEQGVMCFLLAMGTTRVMGKPFLLHANPLTVLRFTGCCPHLRAHTTVYGNRLPAHIATR